MYNNQRTIRNRRRPKFSTEEEEKDGEELKWRIWDYDGTTLRIILDRPTTQTLTLKGAKGYNNGVYLMNEICRKCFGNEERNGISVANLRRSDIQKVSTYDLTTYSHNEDYNEVENGKGKIKFGDTKTYSENNKYPKMWGINDNDWMKNSNDDKECLIWEKEKADKEEEEEYFEGDATIEFKQSYYMHDFEPEEFINQKYYDMIFYEGGEDTLDIALWLAGRCVSVYDNYCTFCLMAVATSERGHIVGGDSRFYSNDGDRKKERNQ